MGTDLSTRKARRTVIRGSVGDYVTDEDFCTCPAGLFRGKCKHTEMVKNMPLKTFEESAKELKQIKSSIDGLNTVYGGYFYNSDALIALYGKYESGKTLLLFQDVEYMASQGKNVLFIDTEGGMKNMYAKWDKVFESRFGKFTGKKYLEVRKGLSNLTEYLGYKTQIIFKSSRTGKSEVVDEDDDSQRAKDKGKMEFRIIESIPAQIDDDLKEGKIDHIVLDSLSAPLKVIPTDQQNFPARATASALILSKLLLLQDKYNVSVAVTSHACHSADTRTIVRGKGIVGKDDVEIGDEVLGIDSTGNVVWTKVLQKYEYDYNGELCYLKGKSAEFLVTPNHRVMLRNGGYIEAGDVNLRGVEVPKARLGEPPRQLEEEEMYSDAFMAICGWYVAEGDLKICEDRYPNEIRFSLNENDLLKVERLLKQMGILKYRVSRYSSKFGGAVYVCFSNRDLWRKLAEFGRGSKNKRIPEWVYGLGEQSKRAFLAAYLSGDGKRTTFNNSKAWSFATKSIELLIDIARLGMSLGFACNVYRRVENNPKLGGDGISYSGSLRPINYAWVRGFRRAYNGKVWCLTTETGNFAVVTGKGKIAFSGNSINPANAYATSLDAAMWGGVTLHHFAKRILLINRSDKVEYKDYRRLWVVRVEDDAQFSNVIVVKIGDTGIEEVNDKNVLDNIITGGEKKRMM